MPPRRDTRADPTPPEEAVTFGIAAGAPVVSVMIPSDTTITVNFGRDKDLKALLKSLQPQPFKGEGTDIPKILEEWIMVMDDYFALAEYNTIAQGIMGRAKLEGPAKLWWKFHCQTKGRSETSMSWVELKESLKEHYLPLNYTTTKMNDFLSCVRKGRGIEVYYEEFIKLSRHAPQMTKELKLSRFILGLGGLLADEVNALRPVSLADALIIAKAKFASIDKKRPNPFPPSPSFQKDNPPKRHFNNQSPEGPSPNFQSVRVNALPENQSGRQVQCHKCQQWGHKITQCPVKNLPTQKELFKNRNKNQQADPPKNVKINYVQVSDEMEEQAHAALDPNGQKSSVFHPGSSRRNFRQYQRRSWTQGKRNCVTEQIRDVLVEKLSR